MSKASKSRCVAAAFSFVDLVNQGIADFLSCPPTHRGGSRFEKPQRKDHRHCLFSTSAVVGFWWHFPTKKVYYYNIIRAFHAHHWFFYYVTYVACSSRSYTFVSQGSREERRPNDDSENYVYYHGSTRSSSEPWRRKIERDNVCERVVWEEAKLSHW